MKSFFFIPASKLEKINFINNLGVDEIIIDLEDSILNENRTAYIFNLKEISPELISKLWVRIPVKEESLDLINSKDLQTIINFGYRRFILPKLSSAQEYFSILESVLSKIQCEVICLVENALLLLELNKILLAQDNKIVGFAIGSHDMMNDIGSNHTMDYLLYPRMKILYLSKAYHKMAIDFASMELANKYQFEFEVKDGLQRGFDAKFIIHPQQLEIFKNAIKPSEEEYQWAISIINKLSISNKIESSDYEPFLLKGQIIEKPHIIKARNIIRRYKNAK